MANRDRSRSAARRAYDRDRLNDLIDRGNTPRTENQSQVVKIGDVALTNAQGELNTRGQLFELILNERENLPRPRSLYTTDPFRRGTRRDGRYQVADRRSGLTVRVGQYLKDGSYKVLKQGESYYRDNRSEYVIHIPVWQNFSRRRQEGERFTSYASYREDPLTGQAYTIPINEITLLPYPTRILRDN